MRDINLFEVVSPTPTLGTYFSSVPHSTKYTSVLKKEEDSEVSLVIL